MPHERFEKDPSAEKANTGDKLLDYILDEYKAQKCGEKSAKPAPTETTCKALEKAIRDYNEILKVSPA
jgi:hypothetical protein